MQFQKQLNKNKLFKLLIINGLILKRGKIMNFHHFFLNIYLKYIGNDMKFPGLLRARIISKVHCLFIGITTHPARENVLQSLARRTVPSTVEHHDLCVVSAKTQAIIALQLITGSETCKTLLQSVGVVVVVHRRVVVCLRQSI